MLEPPESRVIELREGDLVVSLAVGQEGSKLLLDLELRREGRLCLKIHERLSSLEEIKTLIERPKWLGRESDELIRRALKLALEGKHEET